MITEIFLFLIGLIIGLWFGVHLVKWNKSFHSVGPD